MDCSSRSIFPAPLFLATLQAVDEAADHLGGDFQFGSQGGRPGTIDRPPSPSHLKQRYAFWGRSFGNREEAPTIGFRETSISFGQVCGYGECRPVQLIDEEVITAREFLGQPSHLVCQIDSLVLDL